LSGLTIVHAGLRFPIQTGKNRNVTSLLLDPRF
jgi:hypothetical protein